MTARLLRPLLATIIAVVAFLALPAGVASAAGNTSLCTTGNSQASFLVKATDPDGAAVSYYVPIGQCAGWGTAYQMGTRPYAFHVPTGWCAEFLAAPNGVHYTARGSDGGSGGQWVQFVSYTGSGQWWARHYRC